MAKKAPQKVQPVRFDKEEAGMITQIQDRTKPRPSVSFIVKRAVRFAAPKILRGEVPLYDTEPSLSKA